MYKQVNNVWPITPLRASLRKLRSALHPVPCGGGSVDPPSGILEPMSPTVSPNVP